jgi:hypothetical protein
MPETLMPAPERLIVARQALLEITAESTVGDLLSESVADDGVVTMLFAATMAGYPGWHWTVSVAELPDEEPTVLEAELLPGEGALLAPDWVPWSERLQDYRTAQAAAAAAAGAEDGVEPLDDDSDEHDDDEHEDDDDLGDDPDDGIDFEEVNGFEDHAAEEESALFGTDDESDELDDEDEDDFDEADELDVPAVRVEQSDEPEA